MAVDPVMNPEIPYVGAVEGGLVPGKMVKIQGKAFPDAVRFAINYQLGPNLNPRDDIAIHVSPRFPEGFVTRNHIESMSWGEEENNGPLPIQPGQRFEILILCESGSYKIAINGNHFAEFPHRLPYQKVSHLVIDGDAEIYSISYETVPVNPTYRPVSAPDVPSHNFGPPPPGGLYPTIDPQGPPPPSGYGGGYGPPGPPGGYGPPGPPGSYGPPRAYGYEKPEEEDAFGGCLDKVGLALGGLVAAGGVAAAMHAINKKKDEEKEHEKTSASHTESEGGFGNLGALGAALASSLASNALHGNSNQGYPSQDQGGGNVLGSIFDAIGGGGGHAPQNQPGADPFGGTLGSILGGVLGGGGGHHPPPSSQSSDPLGGLGSILGGVLGGGGGNSNQPSFQPSGGYGGYPSGGYNAQQNSGGSSDLLSGIGSAIGSSLFSSALDGLSKHGKDKSHGDNHSNSTPTNYGSTTNTSHSGTDGNRPSTGSGKLTAEEISKGLGLSDDEN